MLFCCLFSINIYSLTLCLSLFLTLLLIPCSLIPFFPFSLSLSLALFVSIFPYSVLGTRVQVFDEFFSLLSDPSLDIVAGLTNAVNRVELDALTSQLFNFFGVQVRQLRLLELEWTSSARNVAHLSFFVINHHLLLR